MQPSEFHNLDYPTKYISSRSTSSLDIKHSTNVDENLLNDQQNLNSENIHHDSVKQVTWKLKNSNVNSNISNNYDNNKLHSIAGLELMCEICGQVCSSKSHLRIHIRRHTGEKPFGCAQCDKRFASSSILNRHLRACHAGIKRYKCEVCGKRFAYSFNVRTHMRTHANTL